MVASIQPQEPTAREREERAQRFAEVLGRLKAEAKRRVERKKVIEDRWIKDLQQYHGQYDDTLRERLAKSDRSKVFVNLTRVKTNAMAARLADMLFPTGDRNWGIDPSPVPELAQQAQQAVERAMQAKEQARAAAQEAEAAEGDEAAAMAADQAAMEADAAQEEAQRYQAVQDEARKRAKAMEAEIEDHLVASDYQAECRDVIEDACKIGFGCIKGPVTGGKGQGSWQEDGAGGYALAYGAGNRPMAYRCDPWSCFPDPDAASLADGNGFLYRHLKNKRGMRQLARLPGFDKDAIRRLLANEPVKSEAPDYLTHLRNITGEQQAPEGPLYHVWEYSGPMEGEDLQALYMALGQEIPEDMAEVDPLDEINVILWFCADEVLKIGPYPMDSGDPLYSVYTIERDEASVYGYGIPYIMRDEQSALNAAWRMLLDNAGLSVGPQIIIDRDTLTPADGREELRPMKIWYRTGSTPKENPPFEQFQIASNIGELASIIQIAEQQIDAVTAMPMVAQGEQGVGVTKTAQGMALLMNSANVIFRRVVKIFDDDVTRPMVRRFYDWLMQFSDKQAIKGDYEIDARGTSVLLVREMQAQNLMMLASSVAAGPDGWMFKKLPLYRKMIQAHMLDADEIIVTDEEAAEIQAAQQQEDPMVALQQRKLELEEARIDADIAVAEMKTAADQAVAKMNYDREMLRAATNANVSLDKIEAQMQDRREQREQQDRGKAVELAMAERTGIHSGGAI